MVKTLASYVGKKQGFYSSDCFSIFSAKIISETDFYGNIKYYRITKEEGENPKERIFVNGENRIIREKGNFVKAKDCLSKRLRVGTMVRT